MTTARVPTYAEVLAALCRSITTSDRIRVKGRQEGYRCKASYSLRPSLVVSPLSMPRVNAIAAAVDEFCTAVSRVSMFADDFFEVCVKVSRQNEYMVKLTLLNRWLDSGGAAVGDSCSTASSTAACAALSVSPADSGMVTLFDVWRRSAEPQVLEQHLRATFSGLVALVAHVRQPTADDACGAAPAPQTVLPVLHSKPDKWSAYVPLTADGAASMLEYTPNKHPFWLSADSFCEVNHEMEDAMFHAIVTFLRLDCSATAVHPTRAVQVYGTGVTSAASEETLSVTGGAAPATGRAQPFRRRAFICGRDVNSVVRTFEGFYSTTTVVTSCPCVFADTVKNGIERCELRAKDALAEPLHQFSGQSDLASATHDENHVLITAGRHGLHPRTTVALVQLAAAARVTDLIYVSCNVASLTRDVHVLKEAMFIAHARTFDFFPGTDYVMTVLHLRPLCALSRCGLLVLPFGVPGTGKSTSGRALATFFATVQSGHAGETARTSGSKQQQQRRAAKKARREVSGAASCVVPRSFLPVTRSPFVYRHVERDQVFHDARAGAGLKAAKQQTHEALLAALGSWEDAGPETERPAACSAHVGASAVPHSCADSNAVLLSHASVFRRVLYLDSTNGSGEARQLYWTTWLGREAAVKCVGAPSSCLALFFQPPSAAEGGAELLSRVQQRGPHPSFPAALEDQVRKLRVIADALKDDGAGDFPTMPSDANEGGAALYSVTASAVPDAAHCTVVEVIAAVFAHLLLSQALASDLVQGAVDLLTHATTASHTPSVAGTTASVCDEGGQ